jgi:hypothetical protein
MVPSAERFVAEAGAPGKAFHVRCQAMLQPANNGLAGRFAASPLSIYWFVHVRKTDKMEETA